MNTKKSILVSLLALFSLEVMGASSSSSSSSAPAVFGSQAHSPAGLLFNVRLVLASDDEKVYTSWVKDMWVTTAKPLIIQSIKNGRFTFVFTKLNKLTAKQKLELFEKVVAFSCRANDMVTLNDAQTEVAAFHVPQASIEDMKIEMQRYLNNL